MRFVGMCLIGVVLAACQIAPPHTYKIALVAPFEGRQRQIGYDAFPALRMAIREQIQAQRNAPFQITFIAYNDNADPVFAAQVARNVALDPDTLVVIGHLLPETTRAAQPIYIQAGMPMLMLDDAPTDCAKGVFQYVPTAAQLTEVLPTIAKNYPSVSGGPPPGAGSARAYLATQHALAIIRSTNNPSRTTVARALAKQAGCL